MAVRECTLSGFLQHSGRVLSGIAEGELLMRRRDGEDLIIMTRTQHEALSTVLRAFASMAGGNAEAAGAVLPWLSFLSATDRAACLGELAAVATAAVATGRLGCLAETLCAWEATGLAAWDELRHRERAGTEEEAPVAVERPRR